MLAEEIETTSAAALYLDLMKRMLTDSIYVDDPLAFFVPYRNKPTTPRIKRALLTALQYFLARYRVRLVEPYRYFGEDLSMAKDLEARREGGRSSKAIELAKNGDLTALRLCLERIIPLRKDRPVNFDMPEIKTPSDALVAATAIMRAVAGGDLTPSEAAELSKTIDGFVRVAEVADLAERIIFRGAREPLSKLLESKRTRRKIKTQLVSMRYTSSGATQKGFQRHLKLRTNMLMKSSACRRRRSLI